MRPAGEIRQALMVAARELARPEQRRGPTLLEVAQHAKVGADAARRTMDNLRRAGDLVIVAERSVDYRNRPVAEYLPADLVPQHTQGFVELGDALSLWGR